MKRIKYILFILTILLSLNTFSQITVIELTNEHGGYIYITEGSTIYIDTMEIQMYGYNSYKFLVDDVKSYVLSDSIELRINITGFKPIVKKFSINNNLIQIKLEEKEFIKTIVNEKVVLQKVPQVIIASFFNDSSLCREVGHYFMGTSIDRRKARPIQYTDYTHHPLDMSIAQITQDSIFSQFYIPACREEFGGARSLDRNTEITNKEEGLLMFQVTKSGDKDLYHRNDSFIFSMAGALSFDKVPFYFLVKDSLKYLKIYPQILLKPNCKIKKKEVVKLLSDEQVVKKDGDKYIIELNSSIRLGFDYWINYYYSTNLFSSVQLITEPLIIKN